MQDVQVAFVGGGVMAEAIIRGGLAAGVLAREMVTVSDPLEERRTSLAAQYGVRVTADNASAIQDRQIVVLAVKPQVTTAVAKGLAETLTAEQVLVSIVAGKSLSALKQLLAHERVVRVMPNTPAQIGQGMTVWTADPSVSVAERAWLTRLLGALGCERYLDEEKHLDMATAVSGSGPAYIFLVMEALVDAGVHIGLSRQLAAELVTETVLGAAALARKSNAHPAILRNMVTSPGGTTAAALQVLEEHALRAALVDAVIAAFTRSQALGRVDT